MNDEDLEDAVILDGFDNCIVGVVEQFGRPPIVCYDKQKILDVLQVGGMEEDEAIEYFEFNIIGAWLGEATPCFFKKKKGDFQ